jgi:hypothetical protein
MDSENAQIDVPDSNANGRFVSSKHVLEPNDVTAQILQLCPIPEARLRLTRVLRTVCDDILEVFTSLAAAKQGETQGLELIFILRSELLE